MPVIIHGSCLEADPTSFDVMIADPPYSEHVHKNATSQSPGRGTRHRELGFSHLSDELRTGIAKLAAGIKRWSLIYTDVEGYGDWITECKSAGAEYIRALAWIRWSMPQLSGCRPPQGVEMIGLYWGTQGGRKSWNGPGNLTHLDHKALRGEAKHRSEKPLDQVLDLVSWFSNPGERVLDPCAGSGTVGLACRLLGREYVGYEIDGEWAGKAAARLAADKLSDRDQERYERWLESQERAKLDTERREKNTAKTRAKLAKTEAAP